MQIEPGTNLYTVSHCSTLTYAHTDAYRHKHTHSYKSLSLSLSLYIYIYIYLSMKKDMRKPFPLHLYQFPLSKEFFFLMKPNTFVYKPSPSSCYTCIFSIILSISSIAYKANKTQKTVSVGKSFWNKKNEISRI